MEKKNKKTYIIFLIGFVIGIVGFATSLIMYLNKDEEIIVKNGDVWVLSGEKIEKLFKMTRFESDEGTLRFARKLKRMGVDEELEKLGAKPGDEVEILGYLFTFKE